jgi:hypothetical protein
MIVVLDATICSGCESGRVEGLTVTMVCKIAERKKDAWERAAFAAFRMSTHACESCSLTLSWTKLRIPLTQYLMITDLILSLEIP